MEETDLANNNQVDAEKTFPCREHKAPTWFIINALARTKDEHERTVKVAVQSDDGTEWRAAMRMEVNKLQKMEYWDVIYLRSNATKICPKYLLESN